MKTMLIGLLLLTSSMAHAECTQLEAQLIAQVKNVISEDATTCTVGLDYSAQFMLNSSFVCPLDVDEVSIGITLPKYNGTCVKAGDVISGVIYKVLNSDDNRIYLE